MVDISLFPTKQLKKLAAYGLIVLVPLLSRLPPQAFSAEPVDLDRAIEVIESAEHLVQSIEYDVKYVSAELNSADDVNSIKKVRPGDSQAHVLFDPVNNRYFADIQEIQVSTPDNNEETQSIAFRFLFANDGDEFRWWYRQKSGNSHIAPDDLTAFGEAIIAPSEDEEKHVQGEGFLRVNGLRTGLCFMPPHYWCFDGEPIHRLSQLIRSRRNAGKPVSVEAEDDSTWIIKTTTVIAGNTDVLRIRYSLPMQRVTETTWSSGKKAVVHQRTQVEYSETDGLWIPVEANIVGTLGKPDLQQLVFSNVKINREVTTDDFRLEFPAGLRMTNYVDEQYYITAEGQIDRERATREFKHRNGLDAGVN